MKTATWLLLPALLTIACGGRRTPPSQTVPVAQPGSITGREQIGWEQAAEDARALSALGWAIYVDEARSILGDADCGATSVGTTFTCAASLPAMSPGSHVLAIAAFAEETGIEGARSSPLQVMVADTRLEAPPPEWPAGAIVTTRDGARLRVERLLTGLQDPSDASFAPDGRLFIAERPGRITVLTRDRTEARFTVLSDAAPRGLKELVALTLDPSFAATHLVFVLGTTGAPGGGSDYQVARFRELQGTLAERALLFGGVPVSPGGTSGAMRFGPDGRLHLALDDGGNSPASAQPSSPNGKLLRLNPEGTALDDWAAGAILHTGLRSPKGLAIDARTGWLWLADASERADRVSAATAVSPSPLRIRASSDLEAGSTGTLAPARGVALDGWERDVLMASAQGYIARLRADPDGAGRVVEIERLLERDVGPVRVAIVGPDGAIYFCTRDALGRLVLE